MYKMSNKKIIGIIIGCLWVNGLIYLMVNLLSLSESLREFGMGFTLALVLVCAILLFIPESKRLKVKSAGN